MSEPSGRQTSYTYDPAGNRKTETVAQGGKTAQSVYTVNEQNRLMSVEKTESGRTAVNQFFYDDSGNMLGRRPGVLTSAAGGAAPKFEVSPYGQESDQSLTPAFYGYDNKNRMVEARNGGAVVANTFNADGYRASKTEDGNTTRYFY